MTDKIQVFVDTELPLTLEWDAHGFVSVKANSELLADERFDSIH